ncbi:MAG: 1,4-dihydroxy-6-naphthoate synthase [Thermodesulfovibrionales bacterium]
MLSLGYSPCPNDTFIFYGLAHGKIGTGDLRFREVLEDVETLNTMAREARLDITKVSFHAFGHLRKTYGMLRSGAALGRGCGPILVAKKKAKLTDLRGRTIAIPGTLTTAFLLLQICDPQLAASVKPMPFHRIMDAVAVGEADAGLLIHEGRFTYRLRGLEPVADLGAWWEAETGLPIPLGCILARRTLGSDVISTVDDAIRRSIDYAFSHASEPRDYIRRHAQELDDDVISRHIGLYVNDFSRDIGDEGLRAVEELFRRAEAQGIIPGSDLPVLAR